MKRLAAVALAIASACSIPAKTEVVSTPGTAAAPDATSGTTSGATPGTTDLSSLLFADPPLGYVVVPDQTKEQSLDDLAQQADDPEAVRARLTAHGFEDGYIRTFTSNDDSQNVVEAIVYRFASAQGAAAELRSDIDDAKAGPNSTFPVPGVAGAIGVRHEPLPGSEATHDTFYAVSFVRGEHLYVVTIGGPTPHSADEVIALARKEDAVAR